MRSGTVAPALVSGICELTLEATDVERVASFYSRVFGLDLIVREDDRVWLACGERTRLGIWSPGPKEFADRGGRHVHFALRASPRALETLVARLREMGTAVRGPVEHPGGDRSVYVEDPEGNIVEVWDFFERGRGRTEGVDAF